MCGGVGFSISQIRKADLKRHYPPEDVLKMQESGRAESFFWHKDAVLPVWTKDGVELKTWGNKDKDLRLPPTGWAKIESLNDHKWDYLHPEPVDIPVDSGYEKRTWFDLPEGTKGILVKKGSEERVYMITQQASPEYLRETGHDREPPGRKINFKHDTIKPA